jgi:hypothetical protein
MIGKKEWFTTRRYTGWGLRPKTWQGWLYVLVAVIVIFFLQSQTFWDWDPQTRTLLTAGWVVLIFLDSLHIMFSLRK